MLRVRARVIIRVRARASRAVPEASAMSRRAWSSSRSLAATCTKYRLRAREEPLGLVCR